MAEMDGIETLKEIRTMGNGAGVPVIMLTSISDRESIVESQKLGIYDYVLKPVEAKVLCSRIKRALEKEKNDQGSTDIKSQLGRELDGYR